MTDLMNGHRPTNPNIPPAALAYRATPDNDPSAVDITPKAETSRAHPNQPHLNTLIHANIVTHLIRVDAVPDTLFALCQMQEMPEVHFAAVFEDGLIALGCPDALPAALATLASRAEATTTPEQQDGAPFDKISEQLAALAEAVEPRIEPDPVGQQILDRLTALEMRMSLPDPSIDGLAEHFEALQEHMSHLQAPTETLTALDAKVSQLATSSDTAAQQEQFSQLASVMTMFMQRVETASVEVTEQSLAARSTGTSDKQMRMMGNLADKISQLDDRIGAVKPHQLRQIIDLESTLKTLTTAIQSGATGQATLDLIDDKIEQLNTTQRTAINRFEAAMGKTVSGLEPTLTHLNARAAETENLLSDWHKDLKTLSQKTRTIADNTGSLAPVVATLQNDLATLVSKPTPQLDLTAQNESFAAFSSHLNSTLNEMKALARNAKEKTTQTAAQSEETIAILQTLPSLISATLRHDVDLGPLEHALKELREMLTSLPETMNLPEMARHVKAIQTQITPIAQKQDTEFAALHQSVQDGTKALETLGQDIIVLQGTEPNFAPLKDDLQKVQTHLTQTTQENVGQLDALRDAIGHLTRHLGVNTQQTAHLAGSSPLDPDTSLNTLRMEFADLITKRMRENAASLAPQSRQA